MMTKIAKRALTIMENDETDKFFSGNSSSAPQPQHLTFTPSMQTQKKRKLEHSPSKDIILNHVLPIAEPNLPDPNGSAKPDDFLQELVFALIGKKLEVTPATKLDDYFPTPTEEQQACYTTDIVSAARNNDVGKLRELQDSGSKMSCFNRFGESLLHMACRRGFEEMAEFLLQDPEVKVRVVDDCGRTPMHDTCWAQAPHLDIARWILERDPSLLFVSDKRGFTPFDYTRSQHWNIWKQFLYDNRNCLLKLGSAETISRFSA